MSKEVVNLTIKVLRLVYTFWSKKFNNAKFGKMRINKNYSPKTTTTNVQKYGNTKNQISSPK